MGMQYLPCMNPACKSFGKPHPNCQCWSGHVATGKNNMLYAQGGAVENDHFCSSQRSHSPECEHHFPGENPEYAVPGMISKLGLIGLFNKGKGSLFDDPGNHGLGSSFSKFASHIEKGHKKINDHIESLFGGDRIKGEASNDEREKIKEILENGVLNKQIQEASQPDPVENFADGGSAEGTNKDTLAHLFPVHNMMIAAAKARAHDYLNNMRPIKNGPKLAFDDLISDPEAEKRYHNAIDIANHPTSVLEKIKDGSVLPDHIKHLNGMYPEVKAHLDSKLTERITKAQLAQEKPSYKIRQGLSMFLGAPLSGELTPSAIRSAQNSFQIAKLPEQNAAVKNKKSKSSLSKTADDTWTADQAAEKRQIAER